MSLYRDEGVVLRTMRLGEADRIVTFLSRGRGKVRAVAKGVRRTTSKFGGRLEPASHVAMQCWSGRELDIVTQVEAIDAWRSMRAELPRVSKAFTLLEVCDQLAQEAHPAPRLYAMLVGALGVLDRGDPALLVPAFCLKALALEGSAPQLSACAGCGAGGELVAFDLTEGGALCPDCRRGRAVSAEALMVMRAVLGGGLQAVLDVPGGALADEVGALATEAMEAHLDRRLRSVRAAPGI